MPCRFPLIARPHLRFLRDVRVLQRAGKHRLCCEDAKPVEEYKP